MDREFISHATAKVDAKDRLIVALDLDSIEEAKSIVTRLDGVVSFFKIGLTLQLAPGVEDFIRSLINLHNRVFLDYKYYDIPETLTKAVARAADLGVDFLTVHGSSRLIKGAVKGKGNSRLKLLTVTVLTSMEANDMAEMGYSCISIKDLVLARARNACEAGSDGVVASGLEAKAIREVLHDNLLIVTPGIRPDGYPEDDQKRKVTPQQAIAAGADYLVVGRPILDAPDARTAAALFLKDMQAEFDRRLTHSGRR